MYPLNHVFSLTRYRILSITTIWICTVCCAGILSNSTDAQRKKNQPNYEALRREMVKVAVVGAGVKNKRVIESMLATERHEFMPKNVRHMAYYDAGVPIGESQTISSPFIVAYMTESLDPQPDDKVLEIGTGSGYQAAVLSPLVKEVYSIEIVKSLGERAAETLKRLKYDNVYTRIGDGFKGWPDKAPFDKIIVTCSPESVPQPLVDQLREGGMIVVPVGERYQQTLYRMHKKDGKLVPEKLRPTLFVPMTGKAEANRKVKPDPSNPKLLNGDFEEGLDKQGFVEGWYYQRKLELVEEVLAPSGQHYVQFKNTERGRPSHLMQVFAVDGEKVKKLKLVFSAKFDDTRAGFNASDVAQCAIVFWDENNEPIDGLSIPLKGTKPWRHYDREIRVPKNAKAAILRIGMFGGTGTLAFDNIVIRKAD